MFENNSQEGFASYNWGLHVKYILLIIGCAFFHVVTIHVPFEVVMILKMVILKFPYVCPGKYLNALAM